MWCVCHWAWGASLAVLQQVTFIQITFWHICWSCHYIPDGSTWVRSSWLPTAFARIHCAGWKQPIGRSVNHCSCTCSPLPTQSFSQAQYIQSEASGGALQTKTTASKWKKKQFILSLPATACSTKHMWGHVLSPQGASGSLFNAMVLVWAEVKMHDDK